MPAGQGRRRRSGRASTAPSRDRDEDAELGQQLRRPRSGADDELPCGVGATKGSDGEAARRFAPLEHLFAERQGGTGSIGEIVCLHRHLRASEAGLRLVYREVAVLRREIREMGADFVAGEDSVRQVPFPAGP
jgi:hypothetical protein